MSWFLKKLKLVVILQNHDLCFNLRLTKHILKNQKPKGKYIL